VLGKSGLGALELYCMGLKATGTYLSRTLSYTGAEFLMERIELDPVFKVGGRALQAVLAGPGGQGSIAAASHRAGVQGQRCAGCCAPPPWRRRRRELARCAGVAPRHPVTSPPCHLAAL
jgi:hypothetical protein